MQIIRDAKKEAAEDMRERAAKAIEKRLKESEWLVGYTDFRSQHIDCSKYLIDEIRALPIDAAQEPFDG